MIKRDRLTIIALSIILGWGNILTTDAGSPSFARSEEEWAKLRDMHLDYDEIDGLITEYNAGIRNKKIELSNFAKDYGRNNSEVSQNYRDMADEIENNLATPDPDSMSYVQAMASLASSRATINNLRATADSTLEDYEIQHINFEATRLSLVQSAKTLMISYYSKDIGKEGLAKSLELAKLQRDATASRLSVGMATNLELLSASEAVLKAEKELKNQDIAISSDRDKLLIMTGFKLGDEATYSQIPAVDMKEIESINLEEDTNKALEQNFVLRANKKRLQNTKTEDQRKTVNSNIASNTENIKASVSSLYQALINAKSKLELSQAELALAGRELEQTRLKLSLGLVSRLELGTKEAATAQKDVEHRQTVLALKQALENYKFAVAGLANAN